MPNEQLPQSEIILYQTEDGRTRIECRFEEETLWLTQALIAELFQVTVPTVNEHLKGIVADREIDSAATIRSFRIVRTEGKREVSRDIEHYNLDAILAEADFQDAVRDIKQLETKRRATPPNKAKPKKS